jgi:hypothetical protein
LTFATIKKIMLGLGFSVTLDEIIYKAYFYLIIGDNAVVLCLLAAAFGTISLIGACAICFRRKKTFEVGNT